VGVTGNAAEAAVDGPSRRVAPLLRTRDRSEHDRVATHTRARADPRAPREMRQSICASARQQPLPPPGPPPPLTPVLATVLARGYERAGSRSLPRTAIALSKEPTRLLEPCLISYDSCLEGGNRMSRHDGAP
jgi:hypothetical protein